MVCLIETYNGCRVIGAARIPKRRMTNDAIVAYVMGWIETKVIIPLTMAVYSISQPIKLVNVFLH